MRTATRMKINRANVILSRVLLKISFINVRRFCLRLKSQCFDTGLIAWKIYAGNVMLWTGPQIPSPGYFPEKQISSKETSPVTRKDPNCKDNLPLQKSEVIEH